MLEKKTAKSANAQPKNQAELAPKRAKPTATKSVNAASKPPAPVRRKDDMYERIQRRAYELWENEGHPDGREHDHWLQAEREIAMARSQHVGVRG